MHVFIAAAQKLEYLTRSGTFESAPPCKERLSNSILNFFGGIILYRYTYEYILRKSGIYFKDDLLQPC